MADKAKAFVPAAERDRIKRAVVMWLNGYPEKPVKKVDYEYIGETGMTVSTVQAPYKVASYIDGSYRAQFQLNVIYSDIPTTTDERLAMDEALDHLATWAEGNPPDLGDGIIVRKIEIPNSSAITARYEDGVEDHTISINIIYEVRKWLN